MDDVLIGDRSKKNQLLVMDLIYKFQHKIMITTCDDTGPAPSDLDCQPKDQMQYLKLKTQINQEAIKHTYMQDKHIWVMIMWDSWNKLIFWAF